MVAVTLEAAPVVWYGSRREPRRAGVGSGLLTLHSYERITDAVVFVVTSHQELVREHVDLLAPRFGSGRIGSESPCGTMCRHLW